MPQLFGADDIGLISQASLWSEGASIEGDPSRLETFHNFLDDEGFTRDRPSNDEQLALAGNRMIFSRYLGPRTIGNKPKRTDADGQLLNGDGYHEFVVHMDPHVDEGAKEEGGRTRYELSYHHVDKTGKLHPQTVWAGNSLNGLNRAHERVKDMMGRVR